MSSGRVSSFQSSQWCDVVRSTAVAAPVAVSGKSGLTFASEPISEQQLTTFEPRLVGHNRPCVTQLQEKGAIRSTAMLQCNKAHHSLPPDTVL